MGLKFLRDGEDSANLVAMYCLDGQSSWNFFEHDWSEGVPDPEDWSLKLLANRFATNTKYPSHVSLKDFSRDKQGKTIYPNKLKFKPSAQIKNLIPSTLQNGNHEAYNDQITTLPENAHLFEVYARGVPEELGGKFERIGDIHLVGKIVKSAWADKNLFTRHEKYENTIADHPEWDKYESHWGPFGKLAQDDEVSFAQESLSCDPALSIDELQAEVCEPLNARIEDSDLTEDQKTFLTQKYDDKCAQQANKKFFQSLKNPEFKRQFAKLVAAAKASGNEAKFWRGMKKLRQAAQKSVNPRKFWADMKQLNEAAKKSGDVKKFWAEMAKLAKSAKKVSKCPFGY